MNFGEGDRASERPKGRQTVWQRLLPSAAPRPLCSPCDGTVMELSVAIDTIVRHCDWARVVSLPDGVTWCRMVSDAARYPLDFKSSVPCEQQ